VKPETPSDNDMKDILAALRKQKDCIEQMKSKVHENYSQVIVMEKHLH